MDNVKNHKCLSSRSRYRDERRAEWAICTGTFGDNESEKDETDIGGFIFRWKTDCAKEALPKNNSHNNNIIFIVKITILPNALLGASFQDRKTDRWRRLNGTTIVNYYYYYYYYYLSSLKWLLSLLLKRVLTLKSRACVSSPFRIYYETIWRHERRSFGEFAHVWWRVDGRNRTHTDQSFGQRVLKPNLMKRNNRPWTVWHRETAFSRNDLLIPMFVNEHRTCNAVAPNIIGQNEKTTIKQ